VFEVVCTEEIEDDSSDHSCMPVIRHRDEAVLDERATNLFSCGVHKSDVYCKLGQMSRYDFGFPISFEFPIFEALGRCSDELFSVVGIHL
jgi:hypothetical protein